MLGEADVTSRQLVKTNLGLNYDRVMPRLME